MIWIQFCIDVCFIYPNSSALLHYALPNEVGGDILGSPCTSVSSSVRPSLCRRHGFRSRTYVCLVISDWVFICTSLMPISRSISIFKFCIFDYSSYTQILILGNDILVNRASWSAIPSSNWSNTGIILHIYCALNELTESTKEGMHCGSN